MKNRFDPPREVEKAARRAVDSNKREARNLRDILVALHRERLIIQALRERAKQEGAV